MWIDKGNDLMLAQLWVRVLGLSWSEMLMCPKVRLSKKLEQKVVAKELKVKKCDISGTQKGYVFEGQTLMILYVLIS